LISTEIVLVKEVKKIEEQSHFLKKTNELLKGDMADFSKILKFMQYFSVLTSEYGFSKHHLRNCGLPQTLNGLVGGKTLSTEQSAEMKLRWKKLGSAISTARMISRLGDFFDNLKFFVGKINDLRSGKTTMK